MGKNDVEKPQKFNGKDFKRWQSKMLFYLSYHELDYVLVPTEELMNAEVHTEEEIAYNKRSNFLAKNHILNGLEDTMYDFYNAKENFTAYDLWTALEAKYQAETAGSKKFLVAKFLDFKMTNDRPVVDQFLEFQQIMNEILAEGMVIDETFQVAAVIERLPTSWSEYKKKLRHETNEITMVELGKKIQVEEMLCTKDKNVSSARDMTNKAHMSEHKSSKAGKGDNNNRNSKHGPNKKG